MSDLTIRQALRDSVNEVLERMFFVEALAESEPIWPPAAEEIAAQLTFQGEPSGSLTLRITSTAGRQIAADFLGADEQTMSDRQTEEVMCELANMICGSVLSRVEHGTTFFLSAPHIVTPLGDPDADGSAAGHAVALHNGTLTVLLTTGTTTCLQPIPSAY